MLMMMMMKINNRDVETRLQLYLLWVYDEERIEREEEKYNMEMENLRMCIQALINPPKRVRQEIVNSSVVPPHHTSFPSSPRSLSHDNLATQIK